MPVIYSDPPQSRNEAILAATIAGDEYDGQPQSRIEYLLLQLKAAIESGYLPTPDQLAAMNSGIDSLKVSQTLAAGEINLFNSGTVIEDKFINNTGAHAGELSDNANYDASDFIEVEAGEAYCIRTFTHAQNDSYRLYLYYADQSFKSRTTARCADYPQGFVFTVPENVKYIRLNFETADNSAGRQDYHTCVFKKGNDFILEYIPYYSSVDSTVRLTAEKLARDLNNSGAIASSTVALFRTVGCCGDSFTAGYLYNKPDTPYYDPDYAPNGEYPAISYPSVMGRLYGVDTAIFAKGGLTTGTFRTDPAGLPALLADDAKECYIIALGLNDHTQNVPAGTESDIDTEPAQETCLGNFGAILRAIENHAPHAKIILCKSLWVMDAGANTPNGYYNYISPIIETLSEHTGIPFIETLYDSYFCCPAYTDGLKGYHPTAPLYAGMGKRIGELVGKLIINNSDYFYNYYPVEAEP